jgi:hypothetical protein
VQISSDPAVAVPATLCSSVGRGSRRAQILSRTELPQFEARYRSDQGSAAASPHRTTSSPARGSRLEREWQTVRAMVHCYCRGQHASDGTLCRDCAELLDYAAVRLERCRFGQEKPTCAKCPVHCYQKARREQIKAVMRYAGPRMLWQHPILSLRHWLDGLTSTRASA